MAGREAERLASPDTPGEIDPVTGMPNDAPADEADAAEGAQSLMDDIEALIDDARTYFDAELSYQKSRAAFVADCLKKGIAFIVVAVVLVLLALIGLTVGLVIALTPLITAWGATAVVVLGYLLIAGLLVWSAIGAFKGIKLALNEDEGGEE